MNLFVLLGCAVAIKLVEIHAFDVALFLPSSEVLAVLFRLLFWLFLKISKNTLGPVEANDFFLYFSIQQLS